MYKFVILAAIVAQASALEPGFKIKFGLGFGAGSSFNYPIATNGSEAETAGWVKVSRRSDAFFSDLVMYCPEDDYTFCALYDKTTEYIAGFQVALAVENFTNAPIDLTTVGFKSWTVNDNSYIVQEQYFVDQTYLDKSTTEKQALIDAATTTLIYNGGVWVPDVNGDLLFISSDASKLNSSETFKIQNCIPGMGLHYYNESTTSTCDVVYPWFTLAQDSDLVATGIAFFGKYTKIADREWFERPARLGTKVTVSNAPDCFYDLTSDPGRITMHIYYVKSPTSLGCSFGQYVDDIIDLFG